MPLRQCVGCGEMKSKREMVRIIKTPEEAVLIDATGKKNGRGAYICANSECLEKARKNRGLERSLKTAISQEIYDAMGKELGVLDK